MAVDFNKFDKQFNLEDLKKDVKEANENGGAYKEVPHGTYEVKLIKLELGETKETEKPMVKGQFKIVEGEFKGSNIFMNQLVDEGWKINNVNDFLKSLDVLDEEDIYFESYSDYNDLLLDIAEEVENQKVEYLLEYEENSKGYSTWKIKDVYRK